MTMSRMLRSAMYVAIFAVPSVAAAQTTDSVRVRLDSLLKVMSCMQDLSKARAAGQLMSPLSAFVRQCKDPSSQDAPRRIVVPLTDTPSAFVATRAPANNVCAMPVAIDRVHTGNGPVRVEVMDSVAANPPGNVVTMPTSRSPCVNSFGR